MTEDKLAEIRSAKVEISEASYAEALSLAEEIGKIKMAQSISSGLSLGILRWFASMKESKTYKGQVLIDCKGKTFTPQTFDELCEGLGFSKRYIYDNLQNFAVLGERYLEEAQQMGLKVRDLRKLRKALQDAPEDTREEIMSSLKYAKNNNEDLKTALDVVCAQYTEAKEIIKEKEKEIQKLEASKESLKNSYDAQTQLLQRNNEQYDEVKEKLIRATSPFPADQEVARLEWENNAKESVDGACLKATNQMSQLGVLAESITLDERADAALKLYVAERVSLAIRDIGMLLRDRLIDIDIESEFRSPEFLHLNNPASENQVEGAE